MTVFETIAVAFAMFSALPVPQPVWNTKNMRFALCAFPLIGLIIGVLCAVWSSICVFFGFPDILRGAGYCLIPILVTGGIHLDGYADTSDALSSYASQEKRHEILRDPHCGAFAVIRLLVYGIADFALCVTLIPSRRTLLCLGCSFVLSRVLSALALTVLPLAKNTGLAHTFASSADKRHVRMILIIYLAAVCAVLLLVGSLTGLLMLMTSALVCWRYRTVAVKTFGGVSGDLAGWFLQKAEIWMLTGLVLMQFVEKMI